MPKKKPIRKIQVRDENSDTLIELDLSIDDEAFVIEYFNENMNATRAYMNLHPRAEYTTARSGGSQIIAKRNIRARIDEVLKEKAMGRDEVLARLGDMARASHKPYIKIDTDGFVYFDFSHPDAMGNIHLIKKIKTKRERLIVGKGEDAEAWEGEWVEVELHDPQRALEMIGKYYKMFSDKEQPPDNLESTIASIPADMLAPDFFAAYRDIMAGNHSEYAFDGGRGSTKSSFVALVSIVLLVNNPTWHMVALRQFENTLRKSVYTQLTWAINQLGLSSKFKSTLNPLEIQYIPTGQRIYLAGANDPTNLKSIKPPFGHIALLWFEEFDQLRGEAQVRNIVQSTLRGGDVSYRFQTWNTPRSKNHWCNKYLTMPKPNRYHLRTSYTSVPLEWLGKVFIDEAEFLRDNNPDAYRHEYGGEAIGSGGLVFENVEIRAITDDEIETFNQPADGIDWGYYPDPFVWGRSYYNPAKRTLYIYDEMKLFKHGNEASYKKLKDANKINPNVLIIADSSEPKSIADYKKYGANIRGAEKGPDSVDYSIKWLQSRVKIIVDPVRAPLHAEEFINYELEQNKDGEYITAYPDKNNHAIDRTRYAHNLLWRRAGE